MGLDFRCWLRLCQPLSDQLEIERAGLVAGGDVVPVLFSKPMHLGNDQVLQARGYRCSYRGVDRDLKKNCARLPLRRKRGRVVLERSLPTTTIAGKNRSASISRDKVAAATASRYRPRDQGASGTKNGGCWRGDTRLAPYSLDPSSPPSSWPPSRPG